MAFEMYRRMFTFYTRFVRVLPFRFNANNVSHGWTSSRIEGEHWTFDYTTFHSLKHYQGAKGIHCHKHIPNDNSQTVKMPLTTHQHSDREPDLTAYPLATSLNMRNILNATLPVTDHQTSWNITPHPCSRELHHHTVVDIHHKRLMLQSANRRHIESIPSQSLCSEDYRRKYVRCKYYNSTKHSHSLDRPPSCNTVLPHPY